MTYDDIADQVEAGKTAAIIATELAAITRHKRDIYATRQDSTPTNPDLLFLLTSRYKVLRLNKSAEWVGGLVDAIEASGSTLLEQGFGELLNNLQITGRQVFTHSDETGDTGLLVESIAAIVGGITAAAGTYTQAEVIAGVNALTGGRLYAGVTAEQVQGLIDAQERRAIIEAASAAANTTLQIYNTRRTRIDSLHDTGLTAEQIEDEIEKILLDPETYTLPGGE